ncbi:MAG: hypothetical protein KGI54_08295 [Pseudomonadota bacterium]|nr:hypothetical protein [Pseudomonadota bacterium]
MPYYKDLTTNALHYIDSTQFIDRLPPGSVAVSSSEALASVVTRRQGRLALAQAGLLTTLETWVGTQPISTQVWYQDTSSFNRNNALIAQAATALGWTTAQLDSLFTLAGTL